VNTDYLEFKEEVEKAEGNKKGWTNKGKNKDNWKKEHIGQSAGKGRRKSRKRCRHLR